MIVFRISPPPTASSQGKIICLWFLKNPASSGMNDHDPATPGLKSKILPEFKANKGLKVKTSHKVSEVKFTQLN